MNVFVANTAPKLRPEVAPQTPGSAVLTEHDSIPVRRETATERLRLLWERRRFLGRAGLAGLLFGALLAFLLPKRFESTTQLMPPDSQPSPGIALLAALTAGTGSSMGGIAGDLLGLKSSGSLFVGILHSRTVADRLIARLNLKKVYGTRLDETARKKLAANTSISEDHKSGILSITVTDSDPARAAAIAQAYVKELDVLVAQLSVSSARREREFLESRLQTVQVDLESAEKEFSQFASKNTTIDIKEQGRAMVAAAATLEGQLIAARAQLEGLKQIYSENNVRVRATEARVAELQRELERLGGKADTSSVESDPPGDPLYPSIRKLPLLGVPFADLYRRTKVQEAVFEALTQQYEIAKVQEAKETPSVKVLDEARAAERPYFPPQWTILFLCTFFALTGAVVLVLGQAHWDMVDTADPRKILAQEVLQFLHARWPKSSALAFGSSGGASPDGQGLWPDSESRNNGERP